MKRLFSVGVIVDYNLSLDEMIKACKLDYVNSDVNTRNFLIAGKGECKLTIVIFSFPEFTSSDVIVAEMNNAGFRPAKIEELLAFGAGLFRSESESESLVALGSRSDGRPRNKTRDDVLFLWRANSQSGLGCKWYYGSWNSEYTFAAVSK